MKTKMRKRIKIAITTTIMLLLIVVSIVMFAIAQAETTKTAAAVGDLYTGDHIVIKLYGAPNMPLDGRGYVYIDSDSIGYFNYAFVEKDCGEIIIYIWK